MSTAFHGTIGTAGAPRIGCMRPVVARVPPSLLGVGALLVLTPPAVRPGSSRLASAGGAVQAQHETINEMEMAHRVVLHSLVSETHIDGILWEGRESQPTTG